MAEHRYNPRLMALIVASALFMGSLDGTIITTALPRMARSFAVPAADLSLGITIYIMVTAALLPISAWIADRLGARSVFAAAIVAFTLTSLLCGQSRTLWQFVGARVLQAAAAALMAPVGNLVLLRATEKRDFVRMVAISTTPALVAPVIGPPVGGFIVSFLDWPWVFYLNLPIGIVGTLLALRYIPNLKAEARRPFDLAGFLGTGLALACLIYGLDRIAAAGTNRALAAGLILAGLLLGTFAIRHARRHPHPLIPLAALGIRTFRTCTATGGALVRIPFLAANFVLPLFFQTGLGMSAFVSGLLLLGYNGGDLVLKSVAGQILRLSGFRRAMTASAWLMALSIAACALIGPRTPLWLMFGGLVLAGAFRSVLFTAMASLAFADVPRDGMGGAVVLSNVTNRTIGAFGITLAAIILHGGAAWRGQGDLSADDCRLALAVLALLCLAAIIPFRRLPADAGAEVSGHRPGAAPEPAPAGRTPGR